MVQPQLIRVTSPFNLWVGAFFAMPCLSCGRGDQPCCITCLPRSELSISSLDGLTKVSGADYRSLSKFFLPFKDDGLMSMSRVLAPIVTEAISEVLRQVPEASPVDSSQKTVIVFPPSSRANMRKRGFNPAERLLRLGLPRHDIEIRSGFAWLRGVADQGGLSQDGRARNLVGSMRATVSNLPRVLIFDDISASGATLREMRRALEASGNQVIGFCVLAESFLNLATNGDR